MSAALGERPLLLILEDCHWIDDLSRDLLLAVADKLDTMPLLLIVSTRPFSGALNEIDPLLPLRTLPYTRHVTREAFTEEKAARLIALKLQQLGDDIALLSPHLIAQLHERAHGNPFYLDELLNFLHERRVDLRDRAALDQLELPDSLQRLILSRIDQLPEGPKQTLRMGSVIGRLFMANWLWQIAPMLGDTAQVLGQLDQLRRQDFVQLERSAPEHEYLFKHLLTREVAYESIALGTRMQLHERIGAYIEQRYGDALEPWLDLLAYHAGASANTAKQREYFQKAAHAATAYAYQTAISYYERLLPLLEGTEQIDATLQLCTVQTEAGHWEDAERHARAALAHAEQLGDVQR